MTTDPSPHAQLARARNQLQTGIILAERLAELARELSALARDADTWVAGVLADARRSTPPPAR